MRPRYDELQGGRAAGVFGTADRFGCLNLLTPARTVAAARLVRTGAVYALNASLLHYNEPNFFSGTGRTRRGAPRHTVIARTPIHRDDCLDGFYPQSGSQWDHFLHWGDPRTGSYYNGASEDSMGVHDWAQRGIVGRGVLLDVARWATASGDPIDWRSSRAITVEELEATAGAQGVDVDPGTIVLVRVGWQEGYERLTPQGRTALPLENDAVPTAPGLEPSAAMAERLWNWGVAAVGSDNPALESLPMAREPLHDHLLGRLGIPVGELWLLDGLADACAAARRYEFLFVSAPLNVSGGVGSPANALALM